MAETYYKYRGVKNISRLASIIREQKLWASAYNELNDPMEWFFRSKDKDFDQTKLNEYKGEARICSVSKSCNYGLMWSMYAEEHHGVCIEFTIDDTENCKEQEPLSSDYWTKYVVRYENAPVNVKDNYPNVDEILGIKSPQWAHEQEIRYVRKVRDKTPIFIKINIKRIFLGVRMKEEDKAIIFGLKAYLKSNFEIVDLSTMKSEDGGLNCWNDCNNNIFKNYETTKNAIGFLT